MVGCEIPVYQGIELLDVMHLLQIPLFFLSPLQMSCVYFRYSSVFFCFSSDVMRLLQIPLFFFVFSSLYLLIRVSLSSSIRMLQLFATLHPIICLQYAFELDGNKNNDTKSGERVVWLYYVLFFL